MKLSIKWVRILAGAGLFLLAAGGLLTWRAISLHQERDRLRNELAEARLQRQALEQVWSTKLEDCEMRARRLAVNSSALPSECD